MNDISYPLPCINCASRLQSEYACKNCIHNGAKSDDKFDNFIPLIDVAPRVNEKPVNDSVNHPIHYATGKYECIDVMLEIFGVEAVKTFCLLNAFKYNYRTGNKNGLEDIKKAKWYIDKYIELSE